MKNIGGLMVLLGLGSIVINLIGYEFRLVSWMDNWGTTVGYALKIGLAVIGAILWFIGNKQESSEAE